MVTPAVVKAFRSIGWGWGGGWAGATKDYMHFSASGH
jgi:D-alanyl-D-alanine carboxypeptidase